MTTTTPDFKIEPIGSQFGIRKANGDLVMDGLLPLMRSTEQGARAEAEAIFTTGTPNTHADAIRTLPPETRNIVIDALCVRAMDFVADGLTQSDAGADQAADIIRQLIDPFEKRPLFEPAYYPTPIENAIKEAF